MAANSAAMVVEGRGCPSCGVAAGEACRTRGGNTAHRYHTQRLVLSPQLRGVVEVLVPADRGPGQPWQAAAPGSELYRIGYACCSPLSPEDMAIQFTVLNTARCETVLCEMIRPSVKHRPVLDEVLGLARESERRAVVTVAELRRLARNSAELTALAAVFQADGIGLEVLDGPLTGHYDPRGEGALFFRALTAAGELDREHQHSKALDGQRAAAAEGRPSGRPKVLDGQMLAAARALRDQGVSVPDIAARLVVTSGKGSGRHPSLASVYRALAESEPVVADLEEVELGR